MRTDVAGPTRAGVASLAARQRGFDDAAYADLSSYSQRSAITHAPQLGLRAVQT